MNLRLQVQQQNIIAIQEVINQKKSSAITKSSRTSSATAKKLCKMITFKKELDRNAQLGQYLLQQTEKRIH